MKYQIKVVQTHQGYVGYAILGDKAVYTTPSHPNPTNASNDVVRFIKANGKQIEQKRNIPPAADIDRSSVVSNKNVTPSTARCCGKG
jgi:hypothetical protein